MRNAVSNETKHRHFQHQQQFAESNRDCSAIGVAPSAFHCPCERWRSHRQHRFVTAESWKRRSPQEYLYWLDYQSHWNNTGKYVSMFDKIEQIFEHWIVRYLPGSDDRTAFKWNDRFALSRVTQHRHRLSGLHLRCHWAHGSIGTHCLNAIADGCAEPRATLSRCVPIHDRLSAHPLLALVHVAADRAAATLRFGLGRRERPQSFGAAYTWNIRCETVASAIAFIGFRQFCVYGFDLRCIV